MFTTETLLAEIADEATTRNDVAYAMAIRSSAPTDWPAVNKAIIARWSVSGLKWIKERAWSGKAFDK